MRCAITRSADYSEENLRKALLEIIDNSEFPSVSVLYDGLNGFLFSVSAINVAQFSEE